MVNKAIANFKDHKEEMVNRPTAKEHHEQNKPKSHPINVVKRSNKNMIIFFF